MMLPEQRTLGMQLCLYLIKRLDNLLRQPMFQRLARQHQPRSLEADIAHCQAVGAVDMQIQRLGKTNTVKLAAHFAAFLQPVVQRFAGSS